MSFFPTYTDIMKEKVIFWIDSYDTSEQEKESIIQMISDVMKQPVIKLELNGADSAATLFFYLRDEVHRQLGHSGHPPVFLGLGLAGYFAQKLGRCFSDSDVVLLNPILNPKDYNENSGTWTIKEDESYEKFELLLEQMFKEEYPFEFDVHHATHQWDDKPSSSIQNMRLFFKGIKKHFENEYVLNNEEPFIEAFKEWERSSEFKLISIGKNCTSATYSGVLTFYDSTADMFRLDGVTEKLAVQIDVSDQVISLGILQKGNWISPIIFSSHGGANIDTETGMFFRGCQNFYKDSHLRFKSLKELYKRTVFEDLSLWLNANIQKDKYLFICLESIRYSIDGPNYWGKNVTICNKNELDKTLLTEPWLTTEQQAIAILDE